MKTGDRGLANVKKFETCVLHAYPDPISRGDPWTIGWGSTGPDVHEGLVWTQEQADTRLAQFIANQIERPLNAALLSAGVHDKTLQSQFDAMVSFAYNVRGNVPTLLKSGVWRAHVRGDRVAAANSFKLWVNARDNKGKLVPVAGLVRRRGAEASLYLEDVPAPAGTIKEVVAQQISAATDAPAEVKPVSSRKTVLATVGAAIVGAGQQVVSNLPAITQAHDAVSSVGGFGWIVKVLGLLMTLAALFVLWQQWQKRHNGEA